MNAVKKAGIVRTDEIYSRAEFLSRVGLSKHAFGNAIRDGLEVKRVGNRSYVSGAAWSEFINSRPAIRPVRDASRN